MEVGTRWWFNGQHYTVQNRETRRTRDDIVAPCVLFVPDKTPGVPRKACKLDWIEEARVEKKALPSGG